MGITPYYFSLIQHFSDTDPIFRQIVPTLSELSVSETEVEDPIGDESPGRGSRPLKALIHRYPNRVLLLPTAICSVYCRFCFRKRLVGDPQHNASQQDLKDTYAYISDHPEIEEVILTGGDPLMLSDSALLSILNAISRIPHIRFIRIHTRLPVVNPYRLNTNLGLAINQIHLPVWISTHFNHVNEVTPVAEGYISDWTDLGIPFLNQTVLLRGVNDDSDSLKALFLRLIELKIRPYYLHQADQVKGTSHLRTTIQEGLRIIKSLQGEIPGYAMPHYVLDSPEGTGKVPLQNPFDPDHGR